MTPPRRTSVPLLYDADLEGAVLGAMLHSPEMCRLGLEKLSSSDFSEGDARLLFEVMNKLGEGDWTRVVHQAKQMGRELRPFVASLAGYGTSNPKLVDDMLKLRRRRSLEDVSALARKGLDAVDPEQALSLMRMLVAEEPSSNGHHRVSASDLLAIDFPEPNWIVPGMLPEGLAMFGGRPKARKSFLVLQMCMARATGGMFLGQRLEAGPVVYFALEDGPRRLAKRLRDLSCPRAVEGLDFQVTMPRLDKGGLDHLKATRDETGAELFVIDTLEKAMVGVDRKRDTDINAHLTAILSPYHDWALTENVALMFVDHLRKPGMTKRSLINDVMGGTAKVGVADTIWGLWREEGETRGEFQMTGRDVEEAAHLLEWKPTPLAWQYVGDLEESKLSESERTYVDAVRELGPGVDSKAVADYVGVSSQAAQEMLRKLREKGSLECVIQKKQTGGRSFLYSLGSHSAVKSATQGVNQSSVETKVGPVGFLGLGTSAWEGLWWEEYGE